MKQPIRGSRVCTSHGANAKQVRAAAEERLLAAQDDLMAALLHIALDKKVHVRDRLVAIRDALNRADLNKGKLHIQVHTSVFDDLINSDDVFEFDRAALEGMDPAALPGGGGDELDSALDDMLDRRERERAREQSTRMRNNGHDVVAGQVVNEDDPTPQRAERGRNQRTDGNTSRTGPVSFLSEESDPRSHGRTEYDPEEGGPYATRRPSSGSRLYEEEP